MNKEILTPTDWIIEKHPDPDNILVTYIGWNNEDRIAVKEDHCYALMQKYAEYYYKEKTEV